MKKNISIALGGALTALALVAAWDGITYLRHANPPSMASVHRPLTSFNVNQKKKMKQRGYNK